MNDSSVVFDVVDGGGHFHLRVSATSTRMSGLVSTVELEHKQSPQPNNDLFSPLEGVVLERRHNDN